MLFTPEDVQSRLRDKPFTPLQIVTTTGQAYDIRRPDLVFVGERALIIGTPSARSPAFFDQVTRVALIHVTELRDLADAASPAG